MSDSKPVHCLWEDQPESVPDSSLESEFFRTVHFSKLSYANTLYELCFLQQIKHYLQVKLHPFSTSALDGGERLTSCPVIVLPVKTPVPIK